MKPKFALELEQKLQTLLSKQYTDVKVNVYMVYGPHDMEEMDGFGADIISDTFLDDWREHLNPLHDYLRANGFDNVQMALLPVSRDKFFSGRTGPDWDGN